MHWIDLTIMIAYTVGIFVVGLRARGKDRSGEDYFVAGGTLHSWFHTIVVGLSIAGTFFSGISFIVYPSEVYRRGVLLPFWGLLVSLPICYLVLRFWFLPRFLSGRWRYPYSILEARFGPATRTVAATLYVLMRVGWMAAMIYAPAVAILTMAHLDDRWFWPIVLITGLSNTIYTVISGVRGVIVTEALHIPVIAFGISATILSAWWQMPVPMTTAVADVWRAGHFDIFEFSVDPRTPLTVWTVVFGASVANLSNYIGDQMSLQRYLATGNVRAASRSFAVNIVGVCIVVGLLTLVGLSLYAFYTHTHDPSLPAKNDQIFPHFVATRLPPGIAGLLLAALLAATGVPAGINTLAGVLTLDFHARFGRNMTAARQVVWGRIYSVAIGLVSTAAAGFMGLLGTLFDASQTILGLFAGPLLSCIAVAVSPLRCAGWAMASGMIVGWLAGLAVHHLQVAALWTAPVTSLVSVVVALGLTKFSPGAVGGFAAGVGDTSVPADALSTRQ